jgi:MFS family permease
MSSQHGDDSGLAAIPWRSSALYVILSSSLMGVMGVSLITPVLPDLRAVFTITDAQVGLVITAYTLPGVFLTPFIGLVADRVGRRRVIIPLLFLFGVAGAAISFAGSFTEVLVLRFVQGIGASALVTLAVTLIGDFYDGAQRDAVMGFNGSMLGTGAALYPLIGGRWPASAGTPRSSFSASASSSVSSPRSPSKSPRASSRPARRSTSPGCARPFSSRRHWPSSPPSSLSSSSSTAPSRPRCRC